MSIFLGSSTLTDLRLGTSQVSAAYLGTSLVYQTASIAPFDSDALNFITASGISGSDATAINTLVVSLKNDNIWNKLTAAYPFIGGTADSNKYNLRNPQNTDAAFRLTYVTDTNASITYSASGFEVKNGQGGGQENDGAYAVTYINPNTTGSLGDEHMSVYINSNYTQTNSDPVQCGGFQNGGASSLMAIKNPSSSDRFAVRMNGDVFTGNVDTTTAGFWVATRNSNTLTMYNNGGTDEAGAPTTNGVLPDANIFIGALNISNNDYGPTWTRFAWFSYGSGLTYTDSVNLYNAVQTYQTSLGRQA